MSEDSASFKLDLTQTTDDFLLAKMGALFEKNEAALRQNLSMLYAE